MEEGDSYDRPIDERRAFVQQLESHDDVSRVDFTRDGFRLVFVGLEADAEFRDRWHRTANRLGYTVEAPDVDESWPGWLAGAWVLRQGGTDDSAGRSTLTTRIRRTTSRLLEEVRSRTSTDSNR